MLEHGGGRIAASRRWGIAPAHLLDLSTGISPWSWLQESGFAPSAQSWSRLPEDDDDLVPAARAYYGVEALPLAGSQAAIQLLPRLRASARVGVLTPAYAEHARGWSQAGHHVQDLPAPMIDAAISALDVLVLCNPNNPDGRRFARETLLRWHARLAARGGWLVVDEAFIDATPAASLAADSARPGLIVLRSLGKFFGLAGARVGFVLCEAGLRQALREAAGPWCLGGPAREVASTALRDRVWQARQRRRLADAGERLAELLAQAGLAPDGGCALFQHVSLEQAPMKQEALALRGILVRRFEHPRSLRFGLPCGEADWRRLAAVLAAQAGLAA